MENHSRVLWCGELEALVPIYEDSQVHAEYKDTAIHHQTSLKSCNNKPITCSR